MTIFILRRLLTLIPVMLVVGIVAFSIIRFTPGDPALFFVGVDATPEEIQALLARRHLAQDHHHCPHGRPTTLVFTRDQLDRQFKRI